MVTIGPPKYNVGTQIGQSLGQGLQEGLQQGGNIAFQRGLLQQALGKVKGLINQKDEQGNRVPTNPLDLTLGLIEAGAGIPGSEKYLATLLPLLLNNERVQQLYGGAGIPNQEAQQTPSPTPAQASRQASKFVEGEKPAGFLASPMSPDEVQQYAENYALTLNDPAAYDRGLAQAQNINAERIRSRQALEQAAINRGVTPEELPRFLQYATQGQHLNDLPAIERFAIDKTLQLRNKKDSLRNLTVPGVGTKLFREGGLIGALTSKGETRQRYLKKYDELVKALVQEGEEPYVRSTLADIGLSPTEVEERIHPLTPELNKKINSLPPGNKMNPKVRDENLVKFFRDNVDNNTSLSVLRHYLVTNKKYNWEEVSSAINKAFPEGQNLNSYQQAELPTVNTPPKQSLLELFGPGGDVRGFFRGQR